MSGDHDALSDIRSLIDAIDAAEVFRPNAVFVLNADLAKSASQYEGVTAKRWRGRARYRQRYARGPR
jgi:hypothetical protein